MKTVYLVIQYPHDYDQSSNLLAVVTSKEEGDAIAKEVYETTYRERLKQVKSVQEYNLNQKRAGIAIYQNVKEMGKEELEKQAADDVKYARPDVIEVPVGVRIKVEV